MFEAASLRTARFDFSKPVEELTAEDEEAFREEFVESLSIGGEAGLYPEFAYTDPDEMPDGLFNQVDGVLRRWFHPTSAFTLLEVGCASGFLLQRVLERYPNATVVGIEPSPVACRVAVENGLDVRNGTTETVALRPRSVDFAVCIGSLMIHENPHRTLAAMSESIRPGGVLLTDVKNVRCTARCVGRAVGRVPGLRSVSPFRKLAARSFEAMRFAFDARTITAMLDSVDCDVAELSTKPPRQLAFSNRSADSRGLNGLIWRALDGVDRVRRQRAWIEVVAQKRPVASDAVRRAA